MKRDVQEQLSTGDLRRYHLYSANFICWIRIIFLEIRYILINDFTRETHAAGGKSSYRMQAQRIPQI